MPDRKPDNRASTNGRRAARKSRVLVVDDEENVRLTTAAILDQEGYDVATASDGREALEIAGRGHFDLVLTDLRMETWTELRSSTSCRQDTRAPSRLS